MFIFIHYSFSVFVCYAELYVRLLGNILTHTKPLKGWRMPGDILKKALPLNSWIKSPWRRATTNVHGLCRKRSMNCSEKCRLRDEPMIKIFNKEHGRQINGAGDGGLGGKNPPEAEHTKRGVSAADTGLARGREVRARCARHRFLEPNPRQARELAGLPLPWIIAKGRHG